MNFILQARVSSENMHLTLKQLYHPVDTLPWVLVIATAGITLRWSGLASGALWFDEAFSVAMSRMDLVSMMQALRLNISPPGWEIVVWIVTRLIGYTELAYRIVPFISSVLALWVFWRLTQQLHFTRLQRAWVVWSHDEVTLKRKEHVEERMAEYVKGC